MMWKLVLTVQEYSSFFQSVIVTGMIAINKGGPTWFLQQSTSSLGFMDELQGVQYLPESLFFFMESLQFSCSVVSNSLRPHGCTPGLPVHHQLLESTQTHVHWVGDASNHHILCRPLLLLPSIFPSIRVFSNKSVLCIRWPMRGWLVTNKENVNQDRNSSYKEQPVPIGRQAASKEEFPLPHPSFRLRSRSVQLWLTES